MTPAAIEIHGLSKRYGRTDALLPTSFTVPTGSIFALLGHNGAGKTTLLKLLVNIFRPTAGSATVLGQPSTSIAGNSFTRIGYVSENQDLPGWMTVAAFLKYQSGFYPQWDDAALIRRFDLPLKRKLKHLSRGQLMKVALASVLAFAPELILLDEPFSGLDPLVRDELIEALLEAAATQQTTIVLSSHDLAEIESFATHVAFLGNGRLLFSEDMPTLSARFREVTVALEATEQGGAPIAPTHWINVQQQGRFLRFVHDHADLNQIESEVRSLYPHASEIQIEPMNLRSVFLAVAKSNRATGREQGGAA